MKSCIVLDCDPHILRASRDSCWKLRLLPGGECKADSMLQQNQTCYQREVRFQCIQLLGQRQESIYVCHRFTIQ